ncbi:MAG: 50S ribosomal protein L9 [Rickettsiales bacterium]|nr:50S ribosomal protein L9 [Rickettsiales bacterium]|tara:strand:- start:656 stop:1321 length:666 start_codon:yes stop_codon:yes gene_type:complete
MKVILKEEIDNLGNAGDLVTVKDGYARNYLIPRQLAIRADQRNVKELEHHQRALERRRVKLKAEAIELERQVKDLDRIVKVRSCGPEGKLFGSVTSKELADTIAEMGVQIEKRQIVLHDPIKSLGDREVQIKLGQGHTATVLVSVEPDEASARAIAAAAKEAAAEKAAAEKAAAAAKRRAEAEAAENAAVAAANAEAEPPADEAPADASAAASEGDDSVES